MAESNNTPLFVIAIGGTGMRCLESFVHLCAIGMFDNKTINILTMDTDTGNGNKERTEQLVDKYIAIKKGNGKDYGQPNINTFFSAVIKMSKYATDYNGDSRNSYINLSRSTTGLSEVQKQENEDLAALFLDKATVQKFNLSHGYRAQTHLGSMLMYHSILESARNRAIGSNTKNKDFDENLGIFLDELGAANNPRVFIFGSVFGGTGASSIPIIPVAFRDAIKLMAQIKGGSASLDFDNVRFGASLLTDYFSFASPKAQQKAKDGNEVIADWQNFSLNSQAALEFYSQDPTVKKVYKRLYNIGWPMPVSNLGHDGNGETLTGGNKQRNDCHVVELMCACAAFDFFTLPDSSLKELSFRYRSPEYDAGYKFRGKDFMDGKNADLFTNKLGAFLSFCHLVLSHFNGARTGDKVNGVKEFLTFFHDAKIYDYDETSDGEWNDAEMEKINQYLQEFAYSISSDDQFVDGWLFQVYQSVSQGTFMFKSDAFQVDKIKNKTVDEGDLFLDDAHNWIQKSWTTKKKHVNSYDKLSQIMKSEDAMNFAQKQNNSVTSTKEKFLAHIYNGITIAQKYND